MRAFSIPTPAPRRSKKTSRHSGASMVEVLVALLLVSFALLGIGGLTAATFGYNKAAQLRLTGLSLVNDYADRARLNIYGYDLGHYAIALSDAAPTNSEMDAAQRDSYHETYGAAPNTNSAALHPTERAAPCPCVHTSGPSPPAARSRRAASP